MYLIERDITKQYSKLANLYFCFQPFNKRRFDQTLSFFYVFILFYYVASSFKLLTKKETRSWNGLAWGKGGRWGRGEGALGDLSKGDHVLYEWESTPASQLGKRQPLILRRSWSVENKDARLTYCVFLFSHSFCLGFVSFVPLHKTNSYIFSSVLHSPNPS